MIDPCSKPGPGVCSQPSLNTFMEHTLKMRHPSLFHDGQNSSHPTSLRLEDMLDLEHIQEINESFAYAIGLASTVIDVQGNPLTPPCNHSRICQLIRQTETGRLNCIRSGQYLGNNQDWSWKTTRSTWKALSKSGQRSCAQL